MTSYSILLLICSLSLSPSECRPETAIGVVKGPQVESERQCGLLGQAVIARTAVAPKPGQEYLKIVCKRASAI